MPPDTIVTLKVDGEIVEMSAADAYKHLGRNISANKRYNEAKADREAAARERAEVQAYVQSLASDLGDPRKFAAFLRSQGMTPAQSVQTSCMKKMLCST